MKLTINIKGTNIDLSEPIVEYFHKKMEGMEKLFDTHEDAEIIVYGDLGKSSNHHKNGDIYKADVRIVHPGKSLYAVSEKEDLYKAIDDVADELMREASKVHGKKHSLVRRGGIKVKEMMRGIKGLFRRRKN